jgi:pimeloyl-ACP methyl ester carboxylesterase
MPSSIGEMMAAFAAGTLKPAYRLEDLADDVIGLLDALGIDRAHLAGLSMGGAIVQRIAVEYPERVLSVTLMSTSPAGTGGEYPKLPPMSDALRAVFAGDGQPPEPDWTDRDATIGYLLEAERPYAGARGVDEASLRKLLGRVYDRSPSLPSANNHFLVDGSDMPRARLAGIAAPARVIHGTHDPLFPLAHGEALASEIPGAKLLVVDGLGHELPPWAWGEVLPALIDVTRR